MFYHYPQNNSGGSFTGKYHHIIIEANSAEQADALAESGTEIYFDGCQTGSDCDCCGDRWSRAWSSGGDETPQIYSGPVEEWTDKYFGGGVLVLYLNGERKEYGGEWK